MATIGEYAKLYGTGNYADTSKRIGTAVDEAVSDVRTNIDRARAYEDRMRKQKLEDYAFEQLKVQEYQGLQIPSDSPYLDFENSFQQAASYIPDAYAALENSDLSSQEKSRGKALLMQQVGALKGTREKILQQVNVGAAALQNGTVSGYNDADTIDFYNGLMTPNSGYTVQMENNQLVLKGTTPVEGKDINIPIAQYGRRAPELNIKGPDPLTTINVANKAAYDRGYYITDNKSKTLSGEYEESIKDAFTSYLDALPNQDKAIKGAAVDYFGFTSEQVDKLANTRNNDGGGYTGPDGEEYANALEYEMENAFLQKSKDRFLNSEKEKLSQEFKKAQLRSANAKLNSDSNKGTTIDPNVYQNLFESIYRPAQGPRNLGAQDVASQQLLPGDVRNVTKEMQSAISGLGFDNLGIYEKVNDNNEFEGYTIPKQGKGKKGSVFISKDETDPEVIFKAIMQAHGVSTAQANNIFTNVFLPQIQRDNSRAQFGYSQ